MPIYTKTPKSMLATTLETTHECLVKFRNPITQKLQYHTQLNRGVKGKITIYKNLSFAILQDLKYRLLQMQKFSLYSWTGLGRSQVPLLRLNTLLGSAGEPMRPQTQTQTQTTTHPMYIYACMYIHTYVVVTCDK